MKTKPEPEAERARTLLDLGTMLLTVKKKMSKLEREHKDIIIQIEMINSLRDES